MTEIILLYIRRTQFEAELNAMTWLIKWEDVNQSENKKKQRNRIKTVNPCCMLILLLFLF